MMLVVGQNTYTPCFAKYVPVDLCVFLLVYFNSHDSCQDIILTLYRIPS